jgi:catalase
MPQQRSVFGSLVLIAVLLAGGAAPFAYTAGWFSPQRLTPEKIANALAPPTGAALGHCRHHAKGICFTGRGPSGAPGPSPS